MQKEKRKSLLKSHKINIKHYTHIHTLILLEIEKTCWQNTCKKKHFYNSKSINVHIVHQDKCSNLE